MIRKRAVVQVDKLTKEIVARFDSTLEAAERCGVSQCVVYSEAKNRQLSERCCFFRFEEDYDKNEPYDGKRRRPVVVTEEGMEPRAYYSISQAAVVVNYSPRTIRSAINNGSMVGGRYRFEWLR